ncbi:heme-binding protein [Pseudomonas sp. MAFF 311095]|uniref:Heme-binding protein n=1 Tax=Pseudomonas petroselini TaxID=2899822 RepID=A0ABS8QUQ1_9PSED|nr:heme-binding protein [Pseudomonas petroselini]MCD7047588.1 heme-binding protein [Pseudomonas petroselini]MCD7068863.1 heme-binding protein [Pseudomonas petroselini]MCD7078203.1 heme-binding protein [Pseudomonas petroselini]
MFRLPPVAIAVGLAGSLALVSLPAAALDLPNQPVLTLAAAQQILTAAQTKAQTAGWPCVISVVDSAGLPILLVRMDNAAVPAGFELAPGKARTAALFRRPSGALEDAINGPRPAAITAQGFVLMRGGFPIIVNGHTVGAVGVSADTPQHDEEIAQAGLAAFK